MRGYLRKRYKAFGYAWEGIRYLFSHEAHAKIHLVAALLVVAAGIIFKVSAIEWCLLSICIGGVWMAEAFNSAIEALADRITQEQDPYIKRGKDLGAAAVLLFVLGAVAVGLIIFIPKL